MHRADAEGAAELPDDTAYYRQRAANERALAYGAKDQEIAAIHEKLARQYEVLVEQLELIPASARSDWLAENKKRSPWHRDWNSAA